MHSAKGNVRSIIYIYIPLSLSLVNICLNQNLTMNLIDKFTFLSIKNNELAENVSNFLYGSCPIFSRRYIHIYFPQYLLLSSFLNVGTSSMCVIHFIQSSSEDRKNKSILLFILGTYLSIYL